MKLNVPAVLIPKNGDTPILVDTRLHVDFPALGDQQGTNFHYAEREDFTPKIIFLKEQVIPERGDIVSVGDGEAYLIDLRKPADDLFVTAFVSPLPAEDAEGIPIPEDCDG